MKSLRSIFKNSFYLALGQAISGVFYFLAVMYLARSVGAQKYGVFSFAESVFMFFTLIVVWGSDFVGARQIVYADKEQRARIIAAIWPMRAVLSIIALIVLTVFALVIRNPVETKLMVIVCGLGLFSLVFLLDWFFWGLEKFTVYVQYSILRDLVFLLGVIVLVKLGAGILWFGVVFILSRFLPSLHLLYFYLKDNTFSLEHVSLSNSKEMLNNCNFLFYISIVGWFTHFFDITLISLVHGETMTGLYTAAYKPVLLVVLSVTVYMKAIYPILAKTYRNDIREFEKIIIFTLIGSIVIFLPVAVVCSRFGAQLIGFIYSDDYSESIDTFKILIYILMMTAVNSTLLRSLIATGNDKDSFISSLAVGISNVVLNLILVPTMGIIGAAWSKLLAECIAFFWYYYKLSKVVKMPYLYILYMALLGAFIYLATLVIMNLIA